MSEKTLKTRIQNKRGTTAEWATGTAPNFVPKDGEIVAYTDVHRIKIGDGNTKVSALPFVDKVRDVTLGGESMVNANGVVELPQTVMTNGYVPVWNNTEGIFEDGIEKSNIVTIDTSQTITASKIFKGEVAFDAQIRANGSVGTAGQVLTSQGSGKAPQWANIPTPSNMVTTDTAQTISGGKTFTDIINFKGQSANTYLFDCYADDGQSDTIVGVFLNTIDSTNGESKGELKLGDGNAECAISLQNSYGTSGQVLTSQGSGKTPKWSSLAYISSITVTKV